MKPIYDRVQFQRIFPGAAAKIIAPAVTALVEKEVIKARDEMIDEFDDHVITREIKDGPHAQNISNTIAGVRGNLFSFIRFESDTEPTEIVRNALVELSRLSKAPKSRVIGKRIVFTFQMHVPTMEKLETLTPMPWEPGSWLRAIERGISGLGYYLYSLRRQFEGSRSGSAIQLKRQLRAAQYKNISYVSGILRNFYKKL